MATLAPVVTLGIKGVLRDPAEKVDALLADFWASDANQSFLFDGQIANLSYLLQQAGPDIISLQFNIRSALERHFEPHFETALVEVTDDTDENQSARITLRLAITVTQNGVRYDVSNLLSMVNGKFEKITKFNNTGYPA